MAAMRKPPKDIEKLSYEDAMERLEALLDEIESGEVGLEDALERAERGGALIQHCRAVLDRVERRLGKLEPVGEDGLAVEAGAGDEALDDTDADADSGVGVDSEGGRA